MQNNYDVIPFSEIYLESAIKLFIEAYRQERDVNHLLPSRVIDAPDFIYSSIKNLMGNPAVAVLHKKQLVSFMVTGFQFPFKGLKAALVPEYCHASVLSDKIHLYQIMYMHLAEYWVNNQAHLHIIVHFAHDESLKSCLYQLGFGAVVSENLRDLSNIDNANDFQIVEEKDVSKLLDIAIEHSKYYKESPLFLYKDTGRDKHLATLKSAVEQGDVIFVYYNGKQEPCAYFIIGESKISGEGFLLWKTNTAQIKSAYAQPLVRRTGIGKALLQCAINWSRERGYERLFVEYETGNYFGGNFWRSYFNPYLYSTMRYVDRSI